MSIKTISRWLLAGACMAVFPLYAQTTTTSTTTTTTKTVTHHATHHRARTSSSATADATRLAALLQDTQANVVLTDVTWKTVANEANVLANRLYAGAHGKARTAARDARMHVHEMHTAAMKGDAAGAKSHASQALPFVYQVIDAEMK